MKQQKEFEVLRFIGHNQICHISSDIVEGYAMNDWVKRHPCMEKEQCLHWIQTMAKQLSLLHKSKSGGCYQYMNPYSMIVSKKLEIHFLDPKAENNESQLRKMQRKIIRQHFLPEYAQYYQSADESMDIYGLGKTIQYLLSSVELDPPITRLEERKIQKLIAKCLDRQSKNSIQHISEIQKLIPVYQEKKKISKIRMAQVVLGIAAVVIWSLV